MFPAETGGWRPRLLAGNASFLPGIPPVSIGKHQELTFPGKHPVSETPNGGWGSRKHPPTTTPGWGSDGTPNRGCPGGPSGGTPFRCTPHSCVDFLPRKVERSGGTHSVLRDIAEFLLRVPRAHVLERHGSSVLISNAECCHI